MKMIRLAATLGLLTAATACTAGGVLSPQPSAPSLTTSATSVAPQVPLLYVVDGVKYPRDQIPALTRDQIAAVKVVKGRAALQRYGPDASYGVVVITTRQVAATPQS